MLLNALIAFLFSSMLIRTRPEYMLLYSFSPRNETVNCLSYIISSISACFEQNETASSHIASLRFGIRIKKHHPSFFSNWMSAL